MHDLNLLENYNENKVLRNSFFEFTKKVFSGLNFKEWYELGYWTADYIPYSLVKNNQVISNVSISKMNIIFENKILKGIQIGTVGTLSVYRKQGLSRYLMKHVINLFENSTDFFFLFANDMVLDFYPKFGFERVAEYNFIINKGVPKPNYSAKKLNIRNPADFELLERLLKNRLPLTSIFGAREYGFITMWHTIYVFLENIYYLPDENIIIIYSIKNNQIHIWDIIFTEHMNIEIILPQIIPNSTIKEIIFYFPPDQIHFRFDKVITDTNSILFVRGNFPIKGKKFKFPITAQT